MDLDTRWIEFDPPLGSSEPRCSMEIGSQRAATSEASDAMPPPSVLAQAAVLANSPHHQLPSAMLANATV